MGSLRRRSIAAVVLALVAALALPSFAGAQQIQTYRTYKLTEGSPSSPAPRDQKKTSSTGKSKPKTSTKKSGVSSKPKPAAPATQDTGSVSDENGNIDTGEAADQVGEVGEPEQAVAGDADFVRSFVSPLCQSVTHTTPRTAAACARTNNPHTRYPVANYNFDIDSNNAKLSATNINVLGAIYTAILSVQSFLWVLVLSGISLAMTALQWLFGWSLLTDDDSAGSVITALDRTASILDGGWVYFAYSMLAVFLMIGVIRRRHGEALGQFLLALGMIVLSFWIIDDPKGTVGYVAHVSDQATMQFLAAPVSGSISDNPERTMGDAMYKMYDNLVMPPWCIVQFNDVGWCLKKATKEERQLTVGELRYDAGALAAMSGEMMTTIISKGGSGDNNVKRANALNKLRETLRLQNSGAERRADLFLRQSPGSSGRTKLIDYYAGNEGFQLPGLIDKAKDLTGLVNPQAGALGEAADAAEEIDDSAGKFPEKVQPITGGGFSRMAAIGICGFGLLGAMCFFFWMAMKLMQQVIAGALLLIATPFILLAVAFGETGRKVFSQWISTLLGTFIMKAIYAAMLGITIATAGVIYAVFAPTGAARDAGAPWLLAWVFLAMYWWAIFLRRNWITEMLNIGPSGDTGDTITMGNLYHAVRLGTDATRAVTWAPRKIGGGAWRHRPAALRMPGKSGGRRGGGPGVGPEGAGPAVTGGHGGNREGLGARGKLAQFMGFQPSMPTPDGGGSMPMREAQAKEHLTEEASKFGEAEKLGAAEDTVSEYNGLQDQMRAANAAARQAQERVKHAEGQIKRLQGQINREQESANPDPDKISALQADLIRERRQRDHNEGEREQSAELAQRLQGGLTNGAVKFRAAQQTLIKAEQNRAMHGSPFTNAELSALSVESQQTAFAPVSDPRGAWRGGVTQSEFKRIMGASGEVGSQAAQAKHDLETKIEQSMARSRQAMAVTNGNALGPKDVVSRNSLTSDALRNALRHPPNKAGRTRANRGNGAT